MISFVVVVIKDSIQSRKLILDILIFNIIACIQSRHQNKALCNTYVYYSKNENAIKDTYCSCKSGKRTVGTCSHAASIIYYLSNTRYNLNKKGTYNIEKVFPDHTLRESSDEEFGGETELDSDMTEIEEYPTQTVNTITTTIYPVLSSDDND